MSGAAKPSRPCELRQAGTAMMCDRCGIEFDVGDLAPPCRPITFSRMRAAAETAAMQIKASAAAAVSAGLRPYRHQETLKQANELLALTRLVDQCFGNAQIMRLLAAKPIAPKPAEPDLPETAEEPEEQE